MTIETWLKEAKIALRHINTAQLDALVLLEDTTGQDRAWLLAHPEYVLNEAHLKVLSEQIYRREKHEPLAFIRGKSEFYGRDFLVTPDTLEPRPETETMIDIFKSLYLKNPVVADIGTGSGAIAITVKLECPEIEVVATEINDDALKIAKKNSNILKADISFYKGNLIEPLPLNPTVLLCNLPYVPDKHTINKAAMFEPSIAIFGGKDGLNLYRQLFTQLDDKMSKPQYIFTEALPFQHNDMKGIASSFNYRLVRTEDFIQVYRLKI